MNFLNIPGLYNSGEAHWQTKWEKLNPEAFTRVQQDNWNTPVKNDWVQRLNQYVRTLETPTVLVAHSLGCITAVHWVAEHYCPFVSGILLVAPADVETSSKECFKTFAPVPLGKIGIPTIVVASMNDPYCTMSRAAKWAAYWGARFVSVGNKGHINSDSNLGNWDDGFLLLRELGYTVGENQYKRAS
jgi:predicted alpha/beta hydrolase family esterase